MWGLGIDSTREGPGEIGGVGVGVITVGLLFWLEGKISKLFSLTFKEFVKYLRLKQQSALPSHELALRLILPTSLHWLVNASREETEQLLLDEVLLLDDSSFSRQVEFKSSVTGLESATLF